MYLPLTISSLSGEQSSIPPGTNLFRLLRLALVAAVILAIVGGSEANSSNKSTVSQSETLRKAGSLVFLGAYLVFIVLHGFYWLRKNELLKHRRTVR